MTNPDVIYKVAVASSNLDIIAIIISAIGVLFSAGLSVLLLVFTIKNNNDNKKNEKALSESAENTQKLIAAEQVRLQNQALQISLFDKRIDVFKAIAYVNSHALAVIFAIDNGFVIPQLYKLDIAKQVSDWEGILADNVIVTGFLFSKKIQENVLLIANHTQQTAIFFETYITADNVSEITPQITAKAYDMIKEIAEIYISKNIISDMSNLIEL